jgi:ribulose-bisphosphate carboxylase large chain
MTGDSTLRVTYSFPIGAGEDPARRARDLAREQTVEVPEGCFPESFEGRVVGAVQDVKRIDAARAIAVIAYSEGLVGGTVPQLLNVLLGNISMFDQVRVEAVDWPDWVGDFLAGPRLGIAGVRSLAGVDDRPLIATSVKPVGLDSEELARRCTELVLGGIDILKDDHSLADQPWAPFSERVVRCQRAVDEANASGGGTSLYVPHLSGPYEDLPRRAETLRELGCKAVMVHPAILGWDVVRWLAASSGLAVFTHPTFSGTLWAAPEWGIAPEVILGDLQRLLGADVVVYPNAAGRFPITPEAVRDIHARLTEPLLDVKPAFPMLGGGIDAERIGEWARRFGPDTIFLVGSSLYAQGDLRTAAARLREAVAEA